jgi:hypothetical protein
MTLDREDDVKDGKQVTEILEAYDLTRSLRAAGELAGCSPNTVAGWVDKRDRGELGDLAEPLRRERKLDEFLNRPGFPGGSIGWFLRPRWPERGDGSRRPRPRLG